MIRIVKLDAQEHEPNPTQPPLYSKLDTIEINIDKECKHWLEFYAGVMPFSEYLEELYLKKENPL